MTDTPNDGGPAFPHDPSTMYECDANKVHQGMSLHQWYAGMAMQGILASDPDNNLTHELITIWACKQADSLLQHEQGADK